MKKLILIFGVLLCFTLKAQQPSLFNFTATNLSATFYGQAQVDGLPASPNDWIAAFDSSGNCCGASQLILNSGDAYINLVIYGDDATTPTIDEGMNGNEDFTLKLYIASSGNYISYPSNTNISYFNGWSNTNGAPLPAYNNPVDVYNFQNTTNVLFNLNLTLCENDASVILTGGQPNGGVYSGNGVINGSFDPSTVGGGVHAVFYILNNDSASTTITVNSLANANLITTGPFCDNETGVILNSVTTGGVYSGSGVINNTFNPDIVGAGSYWITYTLTDVNNCTQVIQTLIEVNTSPLQPSILQNTNTLSCNTTAVSYQWYDANLNIINGANSQTFSPLIDGGYYVEISTGVCTVLSDIFQFVSTTDILDENSDFSIIISDMIIVSSNSSADYIYISDILGKQLFFQKINTNTVSVPLDISEGIYILTLIKNNSVNSIKFKL
jgi:hypothetical protein